MGVGVAEFGGCGARGLRLMGAAACEGGRIGILACGDCIVQGSLNVGVVACRGYGM